METLPFVLWSLGHTPVSSSFHPTNGAEKIDEVRRLTRTIETWTVGHGYPPSSRVSNLESRVSTLPKRPLLITRVREDNEPEVWSLDQVFFPLVSSRLASKSDRVMDDLDYYYRTTESGRFGYEWALIASSCPFRSPDLI